MTSKLEEGVSGMPDTVVSPTQYSRETLHGISNQVHEDDICCHINSPKSYPLGQANESAHAVEESPDSSQVPVVDQKAPSP